MLKNKLKSKLILSLLGLHFLIGISTNEILGPKLYANTVGSDVIGKSSKFSSSNYGIKAVNLDTGAVILEKDAEETYVPASNMKLFTTAAALEILGPDYRFETKIEHDGKIDASGKLNGNLYIVAGNDPSIGSRYELDRTNKGAKSNKSERQSQRKVIDTWAKAIKSRGINQIDGDIIIDYRNYKNYPNVVKTWEFHDMTYGYGTAPQPVNYLDNVINITIGPGVSKNELGAKSLIIENNINKDNSVRKLNVIIPPYNNKIIVSGKLNGNINKRVALPNPEDIIVEDLKKSLKANGVGISNLKKGMSGSRKEILTHSSKPVEELIKVSNKYSENLYAETLKIEAEKKLGMSLEKYWDSKLPLESGRFYDGSGLSRYNAITPDDFIDLLKYMNNSFYQKEFYDSLAVTGEYGTLRYSQNENMRGKIHAKTGSVSGVKAYAGYLYNKRGELVAYSIMINNHNSYGKEAQKIIEKQIEVLYNL